MAKAVAEADAELEAVHKRMRAVLLKIPKLHLSQGWNSWRWWFAQTVNAEERAKRQIQRMRGVMPKMPRRKLTLGWTAWH